ncbi:unnamed protein product, partial [Didymodactylos carnosus]
GELLVKFDDYDIDLKHEIQISNHDRNKQRQIKRMECDLALKNINDIITHLIYDKQLSSTSTYINKEACFVEELIETTTQQTIYTAEAIAQQYVQQANFHTEKILTIRDKFKKPPTVDTIINVIENRKINMLQRVQCNIAHQLGSPSPPTIENTIHSATKKISDYLDQSIRPIFNDVCERTTIIDGTSAIKELSKYADKGLLKPPTLFCTIDIRNLFSMLPQEESLKILVQFLDKNGHTKVD